MHSTLQPKVIVEDCDVAALNFTFNSNFQEDCPRGNIIVTTRETHRLLVSEERKHDMYPNTTTAYRLAKSSSNAGNACPAGFYSGPAPKVVVISCNTRPPTVDTAGSSTPVKCEVTNRSNQAGACTSDVTSEKTSSSTDQYRQSSKDSCCHCQTCKPGSSGTSSCSCQTISPSCGSQPYTSTDPTTSNPSTRCCQRVGGSNHHDSGSTGCCSRSSGSRGNDCSSTTRRPSSTDHTSPSSQVSSSPLPKSTTSDVCSTQTGSRSSGGRLGSVCQPKSRSSSKSTSTARLDDTSSGRPGTSTMSQTCSRRSCSSKSSSSRSRSRGKGKLNRED